MKGKRSLINKQRKKNPEQKDYRTKKGMYFGCTVFIYSTDIQ